MFGLSLSFQIRVEYALWNLSFPPQPKQKNRGSDVNQAPTKAQLGQPKPMRMMQERRNSASHTRNQEDTTSKTQAIPIQYGNTVS